ncbi:hypothetical protein Tco_0150699 [Tanacetum coccineum]
MHTADGSALGSFGQGGDDFIKDGATCNTNIKKCHRKVKDGHFTTAVKLLPSSGVAPYCDDTSKALEVKNPYKPPPSMPSITFFEPPLVVEIDSVFGCIKLFPKDLLKVITSIVNMWLAGRCPHILTKFIAYAPLTPLFKTDNEIRPIAVGTIWRRLVSKLAMKGMGKEMSKYLSDFQYMVGLSGGTKAVFINLQQDCIWRHPLGPLLFALVLHSLVHKIKDSCKLLLHAWYLDDVTVIGYSEEVASVLDIIKASGPGLGLELDIKKTEICWSSCNGLKLREGLFHVDIQRPSSMWKLSWGGICGMDDDYVYALACLHDTIPSFDFSDFTNKDTVPSKAQQTLCLRARLAQDFLLVIPIDGLGQHMSSVEYHTILKRVKISTKKETLVNFLTDPLDGRSTLRPAHVLVFGWLEGNMR